ncbi:serine hydrolase domain-containing protein [Ilumatobacter sp.]|uniref:serine hydrolase domain-containing protein n=1 Tax=Ilumatobacter sp. TaxID=1967498 RepID=UPI003B523459
MSALRPISDPTAVGLDPERLRRIDDHFARYVDDGRLAGWQIAIERHGQLAHHRTHGSRDLAAGADWTDDTIVRLYSMTKPITSVAAMMLHEQGAFQLKDPVSEFIGEFADTPVYRSGSFQAPMLEPQTEPMRIWHLLTHTSGLTYGFHNSHATDAIYRADGFEWGTPPGLDLAGCCARWAALPLAFQPGTEWNYGVSTDVLGRVVEVASGQSLDVFLRERVLEPLGMVDTGFAVPEDDHGRIAELYHRDRRSGTAVVLPTPGPTAEPPTMLGGGGGLLGTAADYLRFARMLRGRGELDGVRLLGPRTVDYMTRNHLPGGADLEEYGRPLFAETTFDGVGFGLGFSVVVDAAANRVPSSEGSYSWGGAASTIFWNDPVEDITALFLTQLLPSSTYPIRPQLQQLVSQAIID